MVWCHYSPRTLGMRRGFPGGKNCFPDTSLSRPKEAVCSGTYTRAKKGRVTRKHRGTTSQITSWRAYSFNRETSGFYEDWLDLCWTGVREKYQNFQRTKSLPVHYDGAIKIWTHCDNEGRWGSLSPSQHGQEKKGRGNAPSAWLLEWHRKKPGTLALKYCCYYYYFLVLSSVSSLFF